MRGRFISLLVISFIAASAAMPAQSNKELGTPDDPVRLPIDRPQPPQRFPIPPAPVGLSQISHAAGMIFAGHVTAIARRPASASQAIETVAITFHVDRAIRGVRNGENLTIRQWAGLWFGPQHYQVGERLVLFLYPASRLGLTSSVGGTLGRFSVDVAGRILLSQQHSSAFAADPVLGGKSQVSFRDFAQHVRRASEESERLR
jgi:hypothetical protein